MLNQTLMKRLLFAALITQTPPTKLLQELNEKSPLPYYTL